MHACSVFLHSNPMEERSPEPPVCIPGMDDAEFRRRGKEMIDYIADYLSNIR